jgi:GABA permease
MIAIDGVIGAGLFVGSGAVIAEVGPGAFITYALTGVLIIMVMRMLGEMAASNPATGSFADYARQSLGGWAGFSVGWLYWYFWVIVVGFEAVAGAGILQRWIPLPLWLLSLILMALMTATNLYSVRSYGEFEYWFAGVKVATIVIFIVLGTLFVLGLWPGKEIDFSNLTAHDGFFPHGVGALFSGIVVVIFSMVGTKIATIAAAESDEPERAIVRATNSVVLRVIIFFVGSIFLLATILPWNSAELGESPYVAAFEQMHIGFAAEVMNFVVLTAVLSCLNSGAVYGISDVVRARGPQRSAETRSQLVLSLLAWAVVLVLYAVRRRVIGDAHTSVHGAEAEQSADPWMHEHISGAEVEVDAAVGEGPLSPDLIRRAREEGYANEAPGPLAISDRHLLQHRRREVAARLRGAHRCLSE